MFGALEDLLYKKRHARNSTRVKKTFPLLYSPDHGASWMPAYGLDISAGGMKIFSQTEIGEGEIPMRMTLDSCLIDVRVRPAWHTKGKYKDGIAHEYGMQLVAANAVDRERIRRWLAGEPIDAPNQAQDDLKEIRLRPDDVDRLIPIAFQHRLFAELEQRGRLAPVDKTHPPLVAFNYGGMVRYRGVQMHRLTIESKVMTDDGEDRFRTRFLFDDAGTKVVVLDGMSRAPAVCLN